MDKNAPAKTPKFPSYPQRRLPQPPPILISPALLEILKNRKQK